LSSSAFFSSSEPFYSFSMERLRRPDDERHFLCVSLYWKKHDKLWIHDSCAAATFWRRLLHIVMRNRHRDLCGSRKVHHRHPRDRHGTKAVKIGGWAVLAAQAASWVTSSELQEIL
jgi:hypothetical protein